ncbi:hydroxyethylthiazole kinase [Enterococcus asini]|uniref:hydroxyethylthiazole kinase n=1 Tax=Enterococcus asini TaxID=57732 RepID=UPI00241C5570|nr:hydroxyethylthiazole kinase [Enterococcus asini]
MGKFEELAESLQKVFPLTKSPLVHCITNEITCETVANALLYVNAKPVMADDPREFPEFFSQSDSLLLNLGHISPAREEALVLGARLVQEHQTPMVLDLVGVAATKLRYELAWKITGYRPQVIKGNFSEMRSFCGLPSAGRGVDGSPVDQTPAARQELAQAMKTVAKKAQSVLLATGAVDLVTDGKAVFHLQNGVSQLDRFTGSGDLVGALIAALLGSGLPPFVSGVAAVSYLNIAGERAKDSVGLGNFRSETLNQLSLLMEEDWWQAIRRVADDKTTN